jgi:hypothetical protein
MTDITQLKSNITHFAQAEGKSELDIVNELLTGAAAMDHQENVEILMAIKIEMIQAELEEIYSRYDEAVSAHKQRAGTVTVISEPPVQALTECKPWQEASLL